MKQLGSLAKKSPRTSFKIIVNVTWHAKSMQELLRYAALYINKAR